MPAPKFCSNCGFGLNAESRFCEQCGTAVSKGVAKPKSEPLQEVVLTNKTEKQEETKSNFRESRKQSEKIVIGFVIFATIIAFSGVAYEWSQNRTCPTNPRLVVSNPKCLTAEDLEMKEKNKLEAEAKRKEAQRALDKREFLKRVEDYRSVKCKAKFERSADSGLTFMYGADGASYSDYELLATPYGLRSNAYTDEWGSVVDRTLMMAGALQARLANVYVDFQIWNSRDELGAYKKQFDEYLKLANQTASKLCNEVNPSAKTIEFAERTKIKFDSTFSTFDSWVEEIEGIAESLSYDLNESLKPKCVEYETNNPEYNVVRCTNLP